MFLDNLDWVWVVLETFAHFLNITMVMEEGSAGGGRRGGREGGREGRERGKGERGREGEGQEEREEMEVK